MIWAIAVRNLLQHRTKTLIIGALVSIGIMLTFAGNALIDSMIRNISDIFTRYYTGDILVTSTETLGAGVFGAQSDDVVGFPVIPVIRDFPQVMDKVSQMKGIRAVTRQLSGYALFNNDDGAFEYGLFFGVESESYRSVMDGAVLMDGRFLLPGERGMVMGKQTYERFKKEYGIEYKPGDLVRLNSFGQAGVKIIEVPVVGIFRFPSGNDRLFPVSFLDVSSLRYLLGGSGGTVEKVDVPDTATAFLESDLDSLFAEDALADDSGFLSSTTVSAQASDPFDLGLGERVMATVQDNESQDWHFIVIRTEKGANVDSIIKDLNREFDDADLLARSQSWWVSAMPDSLTYSGVQILFNVALFILGFVSIIIIMNTLVVSVMERTSEIGTMRALGAQKGFVTRLFIAETTAITVIFGCLGLGLGALIIFGLNRTGIPTDNDALRYLGGGELLRPVIGPQPVLISLALMACIALFSWIYPVLIALKVSPLKAISTD